MQDNKIALINLDSKEDRYLEIKDKAIQQLDEIVMFMPDEIKQLINQAFVYKRIPKEYLLSSILFAYSNASGLAFKVNCMNYINYANLYFALIGSRGDVKSPAMELACSPLNIIDDENYKEYKKNLIDLENSSEFEVNTPIKRKQFLIQNSTVEAAMFNHLQNPYSLGMYVDELSYLIEKMANKNSAEGNVWRVFLLQGYTNKHIDVSRRTTDSYRMGKSYPSLLGSIQNQFVSKIFADGNLESGFVDRLMFTNKLIGNSSISTEIMPEGILDNYSNSLNNLIRYRQHIEEGKTDYTVILEQKAKDRVFKYSQDLLRKQESMLDVTKEYTSKMMISIHKLMLLIHLIKKSSNSAFQEKISLETVYQAELINDFYFSNFKMVLELKEKTLDKNIFYKQVIKTAKQNDAMQKDVVNVTGLTKGHVSKLWNKYK